MLFERAMDIQPANNSVRRSLVQYWPWLVVLVVLLFFGSSRVHLLRMPLERDEGEYAYAGQLILQGIPPYELAYNMKLPGTYYAYALGMAVFGQTASSVHLTFLVVNSLTTIFIFLLGRKLFGVTAGLIACASFELLSLSPAVLGMAAHATQFVVFCAVPAVLLLWQALVSNERRTYFFSGLLFGLAFMMKQPGLFFGLFGVWMITSQFVKNRTVFTRNFAVTISVFCVGVVLPFAFFCLAAIVAGDFGRFWFWTFDYAKTYAEACSFADGARFLAEYCHNNFEAFIGFWVLSAIGLMLAVRSQIKRDELAFVLGFAFFSFLGTTPGLYFRSHYFVLVLPALALIVGFAIKQMQSSLQRAKFIPLIAFVALMAWESYEHYWVFFATPPQQLSKQLYHGNPFVESQIVAQYIKDNSKATDRVAVVGSEPEIYFYAGRHSATGYIYTYALMERQPYAIAMQHEMIDEIEAAKPTFIVLVMYKFSWLEKTYSKQDIFDWVGKYAHEFYEPAGVVGLRPDGQIISLSGQAATNFNEPMQQFIIIYHRKLEAN